MCNFFFTKSKSFVCTIDKANRRFAFSNFTFSFTITELFGSKRNWREHRYAGDDGGGGGSVCVSYWWIWSSPSMRWLTKAICSSLRMRRRQQGSRVRPLEFPNSRMGHWMHLDVTPWFRPMLELMRHQHPNVVPYEQRQNLLRQTSELRVGHDVLSWFLLSSSPVNDMETKSFNCFSFGIWAFSRFST